MSEVHTDSNDGTRKDMRGVLPAGTALRGYELKAILGQGGFGITYRARDTTLGRDVAIKEYLPTALALREGRTTVVPRSADHAEQFAWGRERFLEEARTLARTANTPAARAATPQSADGLWRGTYTCGPAPGANQGFSFELEMRLMNGSGTWKTDNVSVKQGTTYEVSVQVGPDGVAVTRLTPGARGSSVISRQALPGRYDGDVIRAAGRESESGRECTLDLTRA